MTAKELIDFFDLKEHPEGGYYKETYRSKGLINEGNLDKKFVGDRNFSTSIYFLLTSNRNSAFHKINQDEIWHFYKGSSLKIHMIDTDGKYSFKVIGSNFIGGEIPQFTVPANYYFAAEVIKENSYAFVGCTVSPGFDFRDFDLPSRKEFKDKYPKHSEIIEKFTCK